MVGHDVLVPAAQLAAKNKAHFPNESHEYRQARNDLLAEEIELRRHLERVAALRRALPPGADDGDVPGLSVFTRRNGTIRHFWSAEMNGEMADPGQDPRGAPDLDSLWTILDLTPAGRPADWYPKLEYARLAAAK